MSKEFSNNPLWTRNPEYMRHVTSDYFAEVKRRVRQRAKGCCEKCGTKVGINGDTHHARYKGVFGQELEGDNLSWMEYLCRDCHDEIHPQTSLSWGELAKKWRTL